MFCSDESLWFKFCIHWHLRWQWVTLGAELSKRTLCLYLPTLVTEEILAFDLMMQPSVFAQLRIMHGKSLVGDQWTVMTFMMFHNLYAIPSCAPTETVAWFKLRANYVCMFFVCEFGIGRCSRLHAWPNRASRRKGQVPVSQSCLSTCVPVLHRGRPSSSFVVLSFCRFIVIILDLCSCSSSSITNHESQGFTTVSQNVTKLEQVLTEMKSDSTGRSRPSSLLSYLSSHNSFIVYFVKHAPDTCCFALVKWTMSSRLKYIYHEVTPRLQKPPGPTFPAWSAVIRVATVDHELKRSSRET